MNFSICLIAKNEAKTLPRLLESLNEFKAQDGKVLLLDTGSTDKTAQLAKDWGCEVYEVGTKFVKTISATLAKQINRKFVVDEEPIVQAGDKLFDYAAARNYIAGFAPTDMIATPDCDEVFTKFDLDKIQAVIESGVEQLEYNFVFAHDEFGNETIKFMHSKFYNHKKAKWVGVVHEVLSGDVKRQFVGEDVIKLEHWQNEATNRSGYLKGLALDCYLNPDNDRNSHYFGRELVWKNHPKSAVKELKRHIAMERWLPERAQSMIYIGDAYMKMEQYEEGFNWWHKAFLLDSSRREALMRLADFFYQTKDAQKAACYASAALEIPQGNFYADNVAHYTYLPHEILYWAKWYLGDKDGSKYHWEKALSYQPNNQRYIDDGQFYRGILAGDNKRNSEDDSKMLRLFTSKIKDGESFSFTKLGDGELLCMAGSQGENCDGHPYSKELAGKLIDAFRDLCPLPQVYIGEQRDFFSEEKNTFLTSYGLKPQFVNANLLLHREDNLTPELHDFFKAIKKSPRHKTFVGPTRLKEVATLLGADFIEVPLVNAFAAYDNILRNIQLLPKDDIIMFSTGMMAKPLIAEMTKKGLTCIDLGSSFDPLIGGATRTHQAKPQQIRTFYSDFTELQIVTSKPKVSLIIPTLGRPEGLERCQASIRNLNYPADKLEVIIIDGEGTVPEKVKKGLAQATGEYIVYASNDVEFMPNSITNALAENKGLVAFNTGTVLPDEGNICEHFMIRRDLIDKIGGEIFDTDFHHVGVDNLLWAKAKKLGEAVRCEKARVKHYHFSTGAKFDEVYKKGWSHVEEDRALLKQKLAAL